MRHTISAHTLGWAKQDLWGIGAVISCIVTSFSFAKMILPLGDHFGKRTAGLQYTMTLLQGPKDPVLPTLLYICPIACIEYRRYV